MHVRSAIPLPAAVPRRCCWPGRALAAIDGGRIPPSAIFDAQNLKTTGNFLAAFLPPERGQEFIGFLARATLETLAIAYCRHRAGDAAGRAARDAVHARVVGG